MAQATKERLGLHLRNLFAVLREHPDGLQAQDAVKKTAAKTTLTSHELGEYTSGGRRFDKALRFATVGAVKAGWMTKAKGRWRITEAGVTAYEQFTDPVSFHDEISRLYKAWKSAQDSPDRPDVEPDDDGDVTVTYEEAEERAWSEIREYLLNMNPYDFQKLAGCLLEAMGYHVVWDAPPGKDGGIDLIAFNDPLGTRPPRIKVQVKRRQDAIRSEEMRSFMAVLGDQDVGIFLSAGGFTRDAEQEARLQDRRTLTLLGLEQFFDLYVEHYDSLTEDARRLLPLKPIWFLAPDPN